MLWYCFGFCDIMANGSGDAMADLRAFKGCYMPSNRTIIEPIVDNIQYSVQTVDNNTYTIITAAPMSIVLHLKAFN